MPKLGVNVDHVATVRQARMTVEPDPVIAAGLCELAGADSIVCHLRGDRRHIIDRDLRILRETVQTRLNLEMAVSAEIINIARRVKPDQATLVPEKRQEVTTEGGLNVKGKLAAVKRAVRRLEDAGIDVSLFIDPDEAQIDASKKTGAKFIELHTGCYANAKSEVESARLLAELRKMTKYAASIGLRVNAGHGLTYQNTRPVALIPGIEELNIGHSIISRAVFVGIGQAVREMKELIK